MRIDYGTGPTHYGPGVDIQLTGDEVATAIDAYLVAHGVHVSGPRTVRVNGELCEIGSVYMDPSGFVITPEGRKFAGSADPKYCTCHPRRNVDANGHSPDCDHSAEVKP